MFVYLQENKFVKVIFKKTFQVNNLVQENRRVMIWNVTEIWNNTIQLLYQMFSEENIKKNKAKKNSWLSITQIH